MKKFLIFFRVFLHQKSKFHPYISLINVIIVLIRSYVYIYVHIFWHMFYDILWNIFGILIGYLNTYCKKKSVWYWQPSFFPSFIIIETNLLQLSYSSSSERFSFFEKKKRSNRRKIKLHREKIIGNKRKEIISSESNNSEWKIVKKGG